MKRLLIFLVMTGCLRVREKTPNPSPVDDVGRLQEKAALYLKLAEVDERGWIKDTKCDGLLFNSLYALSGGKPVIQDAMGDRGVWYRHWSHDCYPNSSASDISRDMFQGLFLWIWKNKRLDLIDGIIAYGEANTGVFGGWVMGNGDPARTSLRPDGQAAAFEIRFKLGGPERDLRHMPIPRFDVSGYEEHLQVLSILMWGDLRGDRITDFDLEALKRAVEHSPENALFQAAYHRFLDGDQTVAINLLLEEKYFPSNRLPTNRDRSSFYIYERDPGKDWEPNVEGSLEVFSGVDFLFAKAVALGEL